MDDFLKALGRLTFREVEIFATKAQEIWSDLQGNTDLDFAEALVRAGEELHEERAARQTADG